MDLQEEIYITIKNSKKHLDSVDLITKYKLPMSVLASVGKLEENGYIKKEHCGLRSWYVIKKEMLRHDGKVTSTF